MIKIIRKKRRKIMKVLFKEMLISKNILRQGHKLVSQEEASIVVEKLLAREILIILILTQVLHQ